MAAPTIGILTPPPAHASPNSELKKRKKQSQTISPGLLQRAVFTLLSRGLAQHHVTQLLNTKCLMASLFCHVGLPQMSFHLGQALGEQVEVTPQYMPIVLLQI